LAFLPSGLNKHACGEVGGHGFGIMLCLFFAVFFFPQSAPEVELMGNFCFWLKVVIKLDNQAVEAPQRYIGQLFQPFGKVFGISAADGVALPLGEAQPAARSPSHRKSAVGRIAGVDGVITLKVMPQAIITRPSKIKVLEGFPGAAIGYSGKVRCPCGVIISGHWLVWIAVIPSCFVIAINLDIPAQWVKGVVIPAAALGMGDEFHNGAARTQGEAVG
jgi:hypothetical protein